MNLTVGHKIHIIQIEMGNENNLELMNSNQKCGGKWTWMKGNMKTVVDYALVNKEFVSSMKIKVIDDEGEI